MQHSENLCAEASAFSEFGHTTLWMTHQEGH